jgi:hypothetical protein
MSELSLLVDLTDRTLFKIEKLLRHVVEKIPYNDTEAKGDAYFLLNKLIGLRGDYI